MEANNSEIRISALLRGVPTYHTNRKSKWTTFISTKNFKDTFFFFFLFYLLFLKYKVYPFGYARIEGDSKVNPAKIEKVTWLHFKQRKQRIKRTLAFMFCYTWQKKKKKKAVNVFFPPKATNFLKFIYKLMQINFLLSSFLYKEGKDT